MATRLSKRRLIMVIVIVAVAIAIGIVLARSSCSPSNPAQQSQNSTQQSQNTTQQLQDAANFTLPTLADASVTLSDLKGTPVLLNFWATWCPHCPTELHYFESVAQESGGKIRVIAVDVAESASTVQTFFGDYEPTMTIALDKNGAVFANYCQNYDNTRGGIPFTLFIDGEGVIQYKRIGELSSEAEVWGILNSLFGTAIPSTS
jgi:thiol-disulfide isomerase/thioredoxin